MNIINITVKLFLTVLTVFFLLLIGFYFLVAVSDSSKSFTHDDDAFMSFFVISKNDLPVYMHPETTKTLKFSSERLQKFGVTNDSQKDYEMEISFGSLESQTDEKINLFKKNNTQKTRDIAECGRDGESCAINGFELSFVKFKFNFQAYFIFYAICAALSIGTYYFIISVDVGRLLLLYGIFTMRYMATLMIPFHNPEAAYAVSNSMMQGLLFPLIIQYGLNYKTINFKYAWKLWLAVFLTVVSFIVICFFFVDHDYYSYRTVYGIISGMSGNMQTILSVAYFLFCSFVVYDLIKGGMVSSLVKKYKVISAFLIMGGILLLAVIGQDSQASGSVSLDLPTVALLVWLSVIFIYITKYYSAENLKHKRYGQYAVGLFIAVVIGLVIFGSNLGIKSDHGAIFLTLPVMVWGYFHLVAKNSWFSRLAKLMAFMIVPFLIIIKGIAVSQINASVSDSYQKNTNSVLCVSENRCFIDYLAPVKVVAGSTETKQIDANTKTLRDQFSVYGDNLKMRLYGWLIGHPYDRIMWRGDYSKLGGLEQIKVSSLPESFWFGDGRITSGDVLGSRNAKDGLNYEHLFGIYFLKPFGFMAISLCLSLYVGCLLKDKLLNDCFYFYWVFLLWIVGWVMMQTLGLVPLIGNGMPLINPLSLSKDFIPFTSLLLYLQIILNVQTPVQDKTQTEG